MKAWRQHPTQGRYVNRRAQRAAGTTHRNAFFAGGSTLLRSMILNGGFKPEDSKENASA